jgi:hypothetical protein
LHQQLELSIIANLLRGAVVRVKSASKLYTPLFSATLAKAKLAYAIHDELSDRPAQAGQEASFDWLLAQVIPRARRVT